MCLAITWALESGMAKAQPESLPCSSVTSLASFSAGVSSGFSPAGLSPGGLSPAGGSGGFSPGCACPSGWAPSMDAAGRRRLGRRLRVDEHARPGLAVELAGLEGDHQAVLAAELGARERLGGEIVLGGRPHVVHRDVVERRGHAARRVVVPRARAPRLDLYAALAEMARRARPTGGGPSPCSTSTSDPLQVPRSLFGAAHRALRAGVDLVFSAGSSAPLGLPEEGLDDAENDSPDWCPKMRPCINDGGELRVALDDAHGAARGGTPLCSAL